MVNNYQYGEVCANQYDDAYEQYDGANAYQYDGANADQYDEAYTVEDDDPNHEPLRFRHGHGAFLQRGRRLQLRHC